MCVLIGALTVTQSLTESATSETESDSVLRQCVTLDLEVSD